MALLSDKVLSLKARDKTPRHINRWFNKPKDYEGSVAEVASPGEIIPRLHRDAKNNCKVFWASEPYLDANGRSRIDFAMSLCVGAIDGVIRIEAGNDRIPVYSNNDIEDMVVGQKYYKALEYFDGASDQKQSAVILKHLGSSEAPYYRGLAYVAIKGWKLWKWPNRSVPAMRAVSLRNIADV